MNIFFNRGVGYALDSLLIGGSLCLLALAMGSETDYLAYATPVLYAYKVVCETIFGTTAGKYGLTVHTKKYPPLVTALIRNSWLLLPIVLSFGVEFVGRILGSLVVLVVVVSMAADKQSRSIFDHLAQAEVMKKAP